VGTSILKIELQIRSGEKERALMIQVHLLKKRRRKVKVDPKFGGQWKEKEKVPFHLFPLSPQTTLLRPSFFPL
jgi:hypothetical protein